MIDDLKIIKKRYGEEMMHLCRELFPEILETEGALSQILLNKFEPNKYLYRDIKDQKIEKSFLNYIFTIFEENYNTKKLIKKKSEMVLKTPKELLDEVGYILYECHTEKEIQKFKKYYAKGEELCTFNGGRLDRCHVFFAVKKNVNNIKRENFKNPEREDLYGTSVISIQFTKDKSHILSIKNRYNHTVSNPDATFKNNLDNIVKGLTKSFEKEYGLIQKYKNDFEIDGYILAINGKYYKYNYELDNVYYTLNNIIIENFIATRYPSDRYILIDYFLIDLQNKTITSKAQADGFIDSIGNIDKISVNYDKNYKNKIIIIKPKNGEDIKIIVNEQNKIIKYYNSNVIEIKQSFLKNNETLEEIYLPNVKKIGDYFLYNNIMLKKINLQNVIEIKSCFLHKNNSILKLNLPNLEKIENYFLFNNKVLEELNISNLKEHGIIYLYNHPKFKTYEFEYEKIKYFTKERFI